MLLNKLVIIKITLSTVTYIVASVGAVIVITKEFDEEQKKRKNRFRKECEINATDSKKFNL